MRPLMVGGEPGMVRFQSFCGRRRLRKLNVMSARIQTLYQGRMIRTVEKDRTRLPVEAIHRIIDEGPRV